MPKRSAKRPFGSVVAEIAREALWWNYRNDWPDDLTGAAKKLAFRWHETLDTWAYETPTAFPPTIWEKLRQCDSSIYWTPAFIPKNNKAPRARFCNQRWLCPFCYGRAIVNFLRPLENESIQTQEHLMSYPTAEAAWRFSDLKTQELLARSGAVACWRQLTANAIPGIREVQEYTLSATWITPGYGSLESCADELMQSLAYPIGTLDDCPWWLVKPAAEWMRNHRGRVWAGKYRGLVKE